MRTGSSKGNRTKRTAAVVIAALIIFIVLFLSGRFGIGLHKLTSHKITRQVEGQILGLMPEPIQPDLVDPIFDSFTKKKTRKVAIKRIPRIDKGGTMPHPFWGNCEKCHLYRGGAPAGSQWKSLFGSALEKVSTVKKVGPPILPDSTRPHPAAGRCIKCHDIVIEVPI